MLTTSLHSPPQTPQHLQVARESDTWSQWFACDDFSSHGQTGLSDYGSSKDVSLLCEQASRPCWICRDVKFGNVNVHEDRSNSETLRFPHAWWKKTAVIAHSFPMQFMLSVMCSLFFGCFCFVLGTCLVFGNLEVRPSSLSVEALEFKATAIPRVEKSAAATFVTTGV